MAPHLLHGTLNVTVYEIDRLRFYAGLFSKDSGLLQRGKILVAQLKRLLLCQSITDSKIYATVDLDKARVARTRMIEKEGHGPKWNESFHIYCGHSISSIVFTVSIGAKLVGRAYIPVDDIIDGKVTDRWVSILDENREPIHGESKIHVQLQLFNVTEDPNWSLGIKNPQYDGVPYTFFDQRRGCRVTLYQDAHLEDGFPLLSLARDERFQAHRCWEDIFDAICNAKHLIYITGWSVYTEITLVRDPRRRKPGGDRTTS